MVNLFFLLIGFFCFSVPAYAELGSGVGEINLAGWIKNEHGTYTKAFDDAKVTLNSPPQGIKTTSTALVQTSKGLHNFDIEKLSTVDVTRVGKSVRGLAVLGGPVGMTVTAVSLVCELTTICNEAGKWMFGENVTEVSSLTCATVGSGTVTYKSLGFYNKYKLIPKSQCGGTVPSGWGIVSSCSPSVNGCAWGDDMIKEAQGTPSTQVSTPHEPTSADWDSKQSLLNDDRFVPELIEKGADVPTGIPTLTANQKKGLGLESTPTKDAQGNVTGREDTMTEIEAVDAATAEAPGRVIIKESKTTVKYDTNNTQISSTTSTSYAAQPQADSKPQSYEIKFDEVPPAVLPTYTVPNTFASTSWGSGTCPPDIEVATSNITFSIPTQPVCDTAEMINPFVLLLSALIGIYIISGVRGANAA